MTVTRDDLAEALVTKVGLPRNESQQLLEAIIELVSASLAQGETVKVTGFGTFKIVHKPPRPGRNPKTLEECTISARNVIIFRPSAVLKNRLKTKKSQQRAKSTKAEKHASPGGS